ncbi:hypothetical protein [Methylobacterium sp.]|jgi:hypothetical protein|uniref:hypothetical protein n=1 Tax=Methylobacterium sp. TaxID=409 RepID=UPI000C47DE24|nr:hypothetical protein [Methylobacterium sp.]MBP32417.1 hypothetical protein [Methylobacterium sp.]
MAHIPPRAVISPKRVWHLFDVLIEGEPGHGAYALGTWDGERRLAFRWNGTDDNPLGNPQSRGLPTWTMLDKSMHEAVIDILPKDKQAIACTYLGVKGPIVLDVSYHPSGNYTLTECEVGQSFPRDVYERNLVATRDKGAFYAGVAKYISELMKTGRRVYFEDTLVEG